MPRAHFGWIRRDIPIITKIITPIDPHALTLMIHEKYRIQEGWEIATKGNFIKLFNYDFLKFTLFLINSKNKEIQSLIFKIWIDCATGELLALEYLEIWNRILSLKLNNNLNIKLFEGTYLIANFITYLLLAAEAADWLQRNPDPNLNKFLHYYALDLSKQAYLKFARYGAFITAWANNTLFRNLFGFHIIDLLNKFMSDFKNALENVRNVNLLNSMSKAQAALQIDIDSKNDIFTATRKLGNQLLQGANRIAAIFFRIKFAKYMFENPTIINLLLVIKMVNVFWYEVVLPAAKLEQLDEITVQMRVKSTHGQWRNIGHYTTWSVNDCQGFINFITHYLNTLANHYIAAGLVITQMDFAYKLLKPEDSVLRLRQNLLSSSQILETRNFNQIANAIPLTNDYRSIEDSILSSSRFEGQWYLKNVWLKNVLGVDMIDTVWNIHAPNTLNNQITNVTIALTNGNVIAKFTDEIFVNDTGLEMVRRSFIDGSIFTFENKIIKNKLAKLDMNQVFMDKAKVWNWDQIVNTIFLTYDIETISQNLIDENNVALLDKAGEPIQKLSIISISLFHKELQQLKSDNLSSQSWKFFINDYSNESEMVNHFFNTVKDFAVNKARNIHLMAHNSAQFDMIFLLKYLIELEPNKQNLNFLVRNKKFISVDWSIDSDMLTVNDVGSHTLKKLKIKFLDSFLMLPMSLAKAAIQFNVENKGEFDFNLINNAANSRMTLEEYRNDILDYNIQDCRVLWFVMANFALSTVEKFGVNIFNQPTAASIAFATFRTNFLIPDQHKIAITSKHVYDKISPSYMGGATDVYRPTNPDGTKVYTYDINSEYPAMMATKLMPTGKYQHVIGPIDINNPDLIAFVKAKITAPLDIKVPLLPMNVNGKMVTGVGTWDGMYFSQELYYALSLGYKIEPYEAYIFEGRLVFDKFITNLYKERLSYPKSNPMNYICKLIMNSTYGRFGMAPILTDVDLFNRDDTVNYNADTKFLDITNINDNLVMVTSQKFDNEILDIDKPNNNLQISLPIAAAITSYARICIHTYKQAAADAGTLLYSDTDSIATFAPISNDLIGKELGQLKLEHIAEKGIFLSAKVYALHNVTADGVPLDDIIKAKGMKKSVPLKFHHFEDLLDKKEVFKSFQEKWFRNMSEGNIIIKNLSSMIRINEGKRTIITNLQDMFIDTWNIVFEDGKIISPSVVKIGLPVIYNAEGHIDQEAFVNSTKIYLEEGSKDLAFIRKSQEKALKDLKNQLLDKENAKISLMIRMENIYFDALDNNDMAVFSLDQLMDIQNGTFEFNGRTVKTFSPKLRAQAAIEYGKRMLIIHDEFAEYFFYDFADLKRRYPNLQKSTREFNAEIASPNFKDYLIDVPHTQSTDPIILPSKLPHLYMAGEVIPLPAPKTKVFLIEAPNFRDFLIDAPKSSKSTWIPKSEWIKKLKAEGKWIEKNKNLLEKISKGPPETGLTHSELAERGLPQISTAVPLTPTIIQILYEIKNKRKSSKSPPEKPPKSKEDG